MMCLCGKHSACRLLEKVEKRARRYSAPSPTAFGEGDAAFFTGKPQVPGLGRVFLMRNYRADLAKWATADPLGYPDGWNQLAYCCNAVSFCADYAGGKLFYYLQAGWYYYSANEVLAPGVAQSEINSFQDALNHYRSGTGGSIPAGNGLLGEMTASDSFVAGERLLLKGIEDKLTEVPFVQTSGVVESAPGSYRGMRCFTLGSYRLNIRYSACWFADDWVCEGDGVYSRNVRSNFQIWFSGENGWDFEWNNTYNLWENISQELIPGAIAGSIGHPANYTITYQFFRNYHTSTRQVYYLYE